MRKIDIIKIVINEILKSEDEVSENYVLSQNQYGDLHISFNDNVISYYRTIKIEKKLRKIIPNLIHARPSYNYITIIR